LDTTGELTEDVDDAIDNRKTVTVDWEDERCTDPPAAMAPLKVASFDIECTSSHGDLPSPIKEYGKTAHEIVIWVSDQFKLRPHEQILDDLGSISIFRDDVPSSDISKVFAKDKVADFGKIPQYIDADIRNILGTKKSNTEKIELSRTY
jgi:hypothetical protein